MQRSRNKKIFATILTVIGVLCVYLVSSAYEFSQTHSDMDNPDIRQVVITNDRAKHILVGSDKSGGHRFGANRPCKSEFPKEWDDDKILSTTRKVAANDNLNWEQQDNSYYVAESMEGDINMRVVLGPQKTRVITSYPVNVKRNPCPL